MTTKTELVMLRLTSAVMCVTAIVVAQLWIGRTDGTPAQTPPIKWLINTGNMMGRWPPPLWARKNSCNNNTATPNTISRMQMIRGGTAAVLRMPAGEGGRGCCSDHSLAQFSLGLVDLKHGLNNLFPAVRPFPDWQTFVDVGSPSATEPPVSEQHVTDEPVQNTSEPEEGGDRRTSEEIPADGRYGGRNHGHQSIINAVDAFLDDRGRILWVLDSGQDGEDACNGIVPFSCDGSAASESSETEDQLVKPKFVAIDVYTNKVHNIIHNVISIT